MAQSVIGSLRVNLGLDSSQFVSGSRRVQKPLTQMRNQFRAVASVAAAMGTAIAAAALSGARQIDEAAKSARRLDSSIGGFRALELAAAEAGVNLSSLTNDIQTMNRELASIGTTGNGARALQALGLSIEDLEGLDADEKLAVIADQVQDLGLSAGQTTAILRDLGVRNREMALLVLGGGDAIRSARDDIREYGLEIAKVDSDRIEAANDAMGRLGLIAQYAGQQIAIAIVPALGRMAEAMTDSLRDGGMLRAFIDGLTGNLDRLAVYAGVAVAAFGTRYVVALGLAARATFSLSAMLGVLRTALIRTGIGVLIIGAGELVLWFGKLVGAAGGFGNAMSLLKDVALEVFSRMGQVGLGFLRVIQSVSFGISEKFTRAFAVIATGWDKLINGMAVAWNKVAQSELGSGIGLEAMGVSNVGGRLSGTADNLAASGVAAANAAGTAFANARAPLQSLQAMRDAASQTAEATKDMTVNTGPLSEGLSEVAASGGAAAAVLAEVPEAMPEDEINRVADGVRRITDGMIDAIFQGRNLLQSFRSMLSQMASEAIKSGVGGLISGLFQGNSGSGGGGIIGFVNGLLGGARAMGGPVRSGVPYLVNENTARSEIFVPSQSGAILNVPQAQRALSDTMGRGGVGGARSQPTVNVTPNIVNVLDPKLIGDFINTPEGEALIVNVMQRNQ